MWPHQDKVQNRHYLLWFTHIDSIFFFPIVNSTKTLCDSVHKAQNQYFPAVASSWLILRLHLANTPKSFSSEHQLPRFIISLGGPSLRNITLPAPLIASRRWAFSYHPSSLVLPSLVQEPLSWLLWKSFSSHLYSLPTLCGWGLVLPVLRFYINGLTLYVWFYNFFLSELCLWDSSILTM